MKGNIWALSLKYMTIGLFFLLPFVFSSSTMDPVLVPRWLTTSYTLSAIWVVLFLFLSSKKSSIELPGLKLFWIGLFGFLLLGGISIFFAVNQNEAIFSVFKWFTYFSFLIALIQIIRQKVISINLFLKTIFFSSAIISSIAIAQKFGVEVFLTGSLASGVHGGLGNPNLLGSFLLIVFPIALYSTQLFKEQKISFLFIALFLVAAFFSESRTAYLGLIVELLLWVFVVLKQNERYKRWVIIIPSVTIGVVIISLTAYYFIDRYHFFALLSGNTLKTRLILASQSLEMLKDNFLLGVGSGNWKLYLAKYGLHNLPEAFQGGTKNYVRPHNDFVWAFAENGLLGGMFYLLFWVGALLSALKFHKINPSLGGMLLISIIGFFIASLLDYPSERNMHLLFFMSVLAVLFGSLSGENKTSKIPNFIIPILLIGALFSGYVAAQRMEGEKLSAKLQQAYIRQDGRAINRAFNEASISFYDIDPSATPVYFFKAMGSVANQNVKQAIKEFEVALSAHPWHLITLNNLGAMYKADKQYAKALDCYNKAILVSNTYELSKLNRVEALLLNDKVIEGTKEFKKLDLAKDDPTYKYFYDLVREKQIQFVFKRYPDLKQDTLYVKSILEKRTYNNMFTASERKNVPLHIYMLPYAPGTAPPQQNLN